MVLKIQLCLGWEGVARFSNVTETDPNTFDLLSHLIIQGIAIKSWVLHATNRVKFRRGSCEPILGDPGAVSRAGRKGATKFSSTGGKAPGYHSYRTISKRSSECWLPIGHKKCFVLLCPVDVGNVKYKQ